MNDLLDVNIELRIELGGKKMLVEDILKLGNGSIVELDKNYGDPVDVYTNNILFARGEVVSAGDNYGVRIQKLVKNEIQKSNK